MSDAEGDQEADITPAAAEAAVRRVIALAEKLEADADAGGGAAPVARAIAEEIRHALRGTGQWARHADG